jgi:hypothetical protein
MVDKTKGGRTNLVDEGRGERFIQITQVNISDELLVME